MSEEPKYEEASDIPHLFFTDRFFSSPATNDTFEFCEFMLNNYPDDLKFLFKKAQEYVGIEGSQYKMSYGRWLSRLKAGCKAYKNK